MRTTVLATLIFGAALLSGCEDKGGGGGTPSSTGSGASSPPAKTASAKPSSSVATADSAKPDPTPKPAPAEAVKAAFRKYVEAFNANDPKKAGALYTAEAELHAYGEPRENARAKTEKSVTMVHTVMKDAKLTLGRVFVDKNIGVGEWVVTGTIDSKPIGVAGASVLTVNDEGFIKSEHEYIDQLNLKGQVDPKATFGMPVRPPVTAPPAGTDVHETKGTPDEAKLVEAVEKAYGAIADHKFEVIAPFIADDIVAEDFSEAAPVKGAKDFKANFLSILTAFPDLQMARETVFAAGNFIVTQGTYAGTQKGPLGPIKATNQPVTIHQLDIIEMKDGKISRMWSYANNDEFLKEIGVLKEPAAAPAGSASGAPAASASGKPATPPPAATK